MNAAIANDLNCQADEFARQVMETLPATGTDPTALVVLGVALIAAGGVLVGSRRLGRADQA